MDLEIDFSDQENQNENICIQSNGTQIVNSQHGKLPTQCLFVPFKLSF
jgi:hypothetical protein